MEKNGHRDPTNQCMTEAGQSIVTPTGHGFFRWQPPVDPAMDAVPEVMLRSSGTLLPSTSCLPIDDNQMETQVSPYLLNMIQRRLVTLPLTRKVIREGWLMKRGEHIKNWRRRYFKLREDGTFHGYKSQPKDDMVQPLNNFTVRDCQIFRADKPKPFSFMIRGLQWTSVVERLFFVETELERTAWLEAIQIVDSGLRSMSERPIPILSIDLSEEAMWDIPHRPIKRYSINDFRLLKVLGRGTFGKVLLCQERDTGLFYAMKILKKSVLVERGEVVHTRTENRVLQQCRHPFMTELKYSFTTPDRLCFVMEYVNGGELLVHLSREQRFSENLTRFYAAEITLAIGYLHSQNVVYRDLKLENLLLDKDGHIKIADFGLCKEEMCYGASTKTFCGTPEYLAPEVLLDNDYGRAVDWWGLGVVMYEMICGRLPFYSKDHEILFELILQENVDFPAHLSLAAQDILLKLLVKEPTLRLGGGPSDVLDVMSHQFFIFIDWDRLVRKDVQPPWKPDVTNALDTKYIPEEFENEPVALTPTDNSMSAQILDGPYFERFSYHVDPNVILRPIPTHDAQDLHPTLYIAAMDSLPSHCVL